MNIYDFVFVIFEIHWKIVVEVVNNFDLIFMSNSFATDSKYIDNHSKALPGSCHIYLINLQIVTMVTQVKMQQIICTCLWHRMISE